MGAWGTAISSNDTFADIYSDFFEKYNDGLEVPEISANLIKSNTGIINDPDDSNNFWFALAKAQWECKQLDAQIFSKVKEIIDSEGDIEVWRKLDANKKDIEKRKIALNKFLSDLSIERPKAKVRKKKIIREPVFLKGDCLTFKLNNGNYGGAVVLESMHNSEYAYNLVATTNINQPIKPTQESFKNTTVLILNFASWNEKPAINWILPIRYEQVQHLFEVVDRIKVEFDYDINKSGYMASGDFDRTVIESANNQFETINTKSNKNITIKELTVKSKFKFW